jgi:hypothetical protein
MIPGTHQTDELDQSHGGSVGGVDIGVDLGQDRRAEGGFGSMGLMGDALARGWTTIVRGRDDNRSHPGVVH